MRYINLPFTYLLTYLYLFSLILSLISTVDHQLNWNTLLDTHVQTVIWLAQ